MCYKEPLIYMYTGILQDSFHGPIRENSGTNKTPESEK